ncbi:putative transcriptional regulator, MarR family [Bradyrhizobium sp. ORS 278]|uniref:MarR family winged helix-turn-helix transcriptional regulator n=1 Tax=Bradyrhizobium sp. (strain ORS 278) TaxID=114615 RepID=UPI0001507FDE|nr:MarR family transcriptional regulator [Bradyrhizobium sp. ORS 278]CAL80556.1 putative transcriptional regulator, MarR family [Bradyrhizobium sp. ORS 278]
MATPSTAASRRRAQPADGERHAALPQGDERLDLFKFAPFRLNRLAAEVSAALASDYRERYGLDIPEWRVLATLGFRRDACSAQYVAACTRTHKSTISRAVTSLLERRLIERVENADDRREFRLRLTRKGKTLYEELIPRLQQREREIMACLSAEERKLFDRLIGKIEASLDLIQTSEEADAKQAY